MQQHQGILQHLNNSFADCTQNLNYFENVSENVNMSGIFSNLHKGMEACDQHGK